MPLRPALLCDIDGVLVEFVDLTGKPEDVIKVSLPKAKIVVDVKSIIMLASKYTITFATARSFGTAIPETIFQLTQKNKALYKPHFDNLLVGVRTTFKPYLAMSLGAKFIIDDHPKVIDLCHKLGVAKFCTPIFICRGRESHHFPFEVEDFEEAAAKILGGYYPKTRNWDQVAEVYNAIHRDGKYTKGFIVELHSAVDGQITEAVPRQLEFDFVV